MATDEFWPSITPVTLSTIPRKEEILKVTLPLIVESESWPHGKTFKHANQEATIVTFHHKGPKDRVAWYGRVSEHPKEVGGWDYFWSGLGIDHSKHEQEYFEELTIATLVKKLSDSQEIWTNHYSLKPPASNRVFTVVITTHVETDETTGLRSGYVISIPVDVSSDPDLSKLEQRATRGYYASIERIQETADGGVNWRMITTSTPGGYIPQWISDQAMPGKIQGDVPFFLEWAANRAKAASTSQ